MQVRWERGLPCHLLVENIIHRKLRKAPFLFWLEVVSLPHYESKSPWMDPTCPWASIAFPDPSL